MVETEARPAETPTIEDWTQTPWRTLEQHVYRLQKRIYRAQSRGDVRVVHNLQRLLMKSRAARTIAVRRVTQDNQGKRTAGIDGVKSVGPMVRLLLVDRLRHPEAIKALLIHNNTDMLLYTSDNPVALHQRERDGRRHIGLVETGVETSMPLSPHLALLICDRSEPLPDGLEIEARRTDIAFLNVHQTWSSDRCLFSANDNFDTARAMIAKFPELTDPSRARLETID